MAFSLFLTGVQVSSQMRMNFNKILLKTTLNYYNNYEKLQRMMKMGNKMKLFSSNGHTTSNNNNNNCLQDIKKHGMDGFNVWLYVNISIFNFIKLITPYEQYTAVEDGKKERLICMLKIIPATTLWLIDSLYFIQYIFINGRVRAAKKMFKLKTTKCDPPTFPL